MATEKILILGNDGTSTSIVYHYLSKRFNVVQVVIEESESKKVFLKRRIKRLGYFVVLGQILFQLFVVKFLNSISKKRIKEIIDDNQLNTSDIPSNIITRVSSINHSKTIETIQKLNPDVIIVNGTRIISKKVIQSSPCKLINMHAGITPKYRGVHGGYWALASNDAENCGVTIHYVDEGIDTGNILAQDTIRVLKNDNFTTYPLLQISKGLSIMERVISNELANNSVTKSNSLDSYLWYHPTIFQYLVKWIKTGVK